ncbi:hypothetical protein GFB56_22560 [Ensifer sp. T173]|uniref:beta-lactamase n=1 Tax=Ensifer canadensis TaxID=555315 RepID=A0AAW4FQE3_9HYPH|nr:serine hydrolase [Ensifer canadensis]MBM3093547.1 hypothetical protein [Ensifer canadensis]UBI78399.1 class A beta-lactamase-related serine hydrolase [Ensifer canadensis]
MNVKILVSQAHPAAHALAQALSMTNGALDESRVGIAACLYDAPLRMADPGEFLNLPWFGHQATKPVYPASVVKLFFLDALASFREQGHLAEHEEDDRAAEQMMAISSNEATVYLVGRLTGADDGAPLQGEALEEWCAARHRVQQWFQSQNRSEFAGINVLHGTYEDSPYGRAKQIRNGKNGNLLTPLSAAALMHDIARGARARSDWMMGLMNREFQRHSNDADPAGDQVLGFLVEGLPRDVMTWSKAGHTSWTRHDLVYGETPDGKSFVLCVMCDGEWSATDKSFLPNFAQLFYRHAFQA